MVYNKERSLAACATDYVRKPEFISSHISSRYLKMLSRCRVRRHPSSDLVAVIHREVVWVEMWNMYASLCFIMVLETSGTIFSVKQLKYSVSVVGVLRFRTFVYFSVYLHKLNTVIIISDRFPHCAFLIQDYTYWPTVFHNYIDIVNTTWVLLIKSKITYE